MRKQVSSTIFSDGTLPRSVSGVNLTEVRFESPHDKTNKMTCVPSEDSDQPGHPSSLISLRCLHEETLDP